jgi:hypothetical protein
VFHRNDARIDGNISAGLFVVIVGDRRAILDLALAGGGAGRVQKCLRQHCFSRASMRDQSNVAKKLGGILFHESALPQGYVLPLVFRWLNVSEE